MSATSSNAAIRNQMPRTPPPISAEYLTRVTSWYLERRATTSAHLKRLLMDRVRRSIIAHGGDRSAAEILVDAEIARLQELGFLNDALYAEHRAQALHARGTSERRIQAALHAKGLDRGQIDEAIDVLAEAEANPELSAAATWARKRRLGPWRRDEATPESRKKELDKMGRAGFSYAIARAVIDATDPESLAS
jgi:regulatory protein